MPPTIVPSSVEPTPSYALRWLDTCEPNTRHRLTEPARGPLPFTADERFIPTSLFMVYMHDLPVALLGCGNMGRHTPSAFAGNHTYTLHITALLVGGHTSHVQHARSAACGANTCWRHLQSKDIPFSHTLSSKYRRHLCCPFLLVRGDVAHLEGGKTACSVRIFSHHCTEGLWWNSGLGGSFRNS